ncbi:MAG: hypothetical protein MUO52_17660 [Desulfobacterales bacterium]|nr:hypothetical protein [Desulfobacterales bacterium]
MGDIKLYDLVDIYSPKAVLEEVQVILRLISSGFDIAPITSTFNMVVRVFEGDHSEYRACNTYYHDLRHTTDAFLAMARLIHGAYINGKSFNERHIIIALISALFHDTGYIQEKHDTEGTGAKHSLYHVERSADFLKRHGAEHGLSEKEIAQGCSLILCTDLSTEISSLPFTSSTIEFLGRMMNAADLIGQMSDRTYLEKLLFLYHEYKEGNVGSYESEVDLLRKTVDFYVFIDQRLHPVIDQVDRFMISHLTSRWGIHTNLFAKAVEGQRSYLKEILAIPDSDPREHLYRYAIVDEVRGIYGPD